MLGLDTRAEDEACIFAPKAEDVGLKLDEGTETGGAEAGAMTDDGLKAEADEHALPDTVTVVVESNRTVLTPSGPVELKMDVPFDAPEIEPAVGAPGGAKEVKEMVLEGVIPPKLNVPVGGKELNWRLFSLMTDGEAPGPLRLIIDGEATEGL